MSLRIKFELSKTLKSRLVSFNLEFTKDLELLSKLKNFKFAEARSLVL